jgi:hypothetical protein
MDDDDSAMDDDDSAGDIVCEDAFVVACGDVLVGETNAGGAMNFDAYACADYDATGPEAYYEFTAAEAGAVQVVMTPTAEDLDLIVLGNDDLGCDEDDCVVASQEVGAETVTFEAVAGESYTFVVDGYEGAEDTFDLAVTCGDVELYTWVAVRSRTATMADVDTNTPGPDIDAVELQTVDSFHYAQDLLFVQGDAGAAGNANDDATAAAGPSDAFEDDGSCVLDEAVPGPAAFWSMGAGDPALGIEGWMIATFGDGVSISAGDAITVYEVGADDCNNVGTLRDDEYEVYIGLSTVDPSAMGVSDLEGEGFMSLGTTGTDGGIHSFDVNLPGR